MLVSLPRICSVVIGFLLLVSGGMDAHRQTRPQPAAAPSAWGDLVVPGGAKELLASAGLVTSIEAWRAVPAVIEQFYGGLNPRVPREFRSYGTREGMGSDSAAPLPLGAEFWTRVLNAPVAPGRLLPSILASRTFASLYYGLLSMDTPTLSAVQADPALASMLIRHAERLPVHAKAIRVRGGRVDLPGGDSFVPQWTDLVGPPDRPAAFVEKLLTTDDGRLGYFYNTIDALPGPALRFVAGAPQLTAEERRKRFQAFYRVFSSAMPTWDGPERRFFPIRGGPASALFSVTFEADGSLAGPPWLAFWNRAFAERPQAADLDFQQMADAADVLGVLCPGGRCDEERVRTLAFIQRQPEAGSRQHVGPLFAAVRTRRHYPTLALELERLHLGDLAIYDVAGSVARRIDDLPRAHRRVALAQFQGSLALLRRLRASGTPAADVRKRFDALVAVPLHDDGYRGGVLRWLVVDLLAAATTDIDEAAFRALAGTAPPGPAVEWEGLRYRVETTTTELARIRSARARFKSQDLASAWALLGKGDRGADAAAAEAITALVYSVLVQDEATPLAISRELPQRHDFFSRVPGESLSPPWTLGSVRLAPGTMRHVGGSLLALESGVPELASRRLGGDRPSDRARISPVFVDGLLRTAAITPLWADSTEDATSIVSAVERGATLARDLAPLEGALASAGIAGPRAGWIRWAIARGQPAPSSVLRLEDLVRLGDPQLTLEAVGAAAVPLECVCLRFPAVSWELRGQPPDHFLAAALSVEAPLRVAYELRQRKLPSVLTFGVLSLLMADLVETGALAHPADVHGVADTVRAMSATRFDDYIAAVAARGPLVPVSSGGGAGR